jgi:hypothetical protein
MASKLGQGVSPGTKARLVGVSSAKERPACGLGGARCKGGVSSSQALAWNKGTCAQQLGAPWQKESIQMT